MEVFITRLFILVVFVNAALKTRKKKKHKGSCNINYGKFTP